LNCDPSYRGFAGNLIDKGRTAATPAGGTQGIGVQALRPKAIEAL